MLVLAIDTALARCSAAIVHDGSTEALAVVSEEMARGHAEALSGMIAEAREKAGTSLKDIDLFAVTIGPGTFTGVRVGLAMAKGLGLSLGKPVVGVSTLEVLADAALEKSRDAVLIVLDARREEVYAQLFAKDGQSMSEPGLYRIEEIGAVFQGHDGYLAGSGAVSIKEQFPRCGEIDIDPLPDPVRLARIALNRDPAQTPPRPLYLRKPDAKPQKLLVAHKPQQVELLTADAQHAAILAEVHRRCFAKSWSGKEFAELLGSPGMLALLAVSAVAQNPVGFVLIRVTATEAEIITICILPDHQRRKIGMTLMQQAIRTAREWGAKDMFLEVDPDNAAAVTLYGNLGFLPAGKRRNYYRHRDGGSSDALTLRKSL